MSRKNRYLDELGIPRKIYGGNFVREKKVYRLLQRRQYGFDYRDIFNMDVSFAEWLYSHMRMYMDNSVHDDTANTIVFEGDEYTIEETAQYISKQISLAGANYEIFSESAILAVHSLSSGFPRVINQLCTHSLIYGCQCKKQVIDEECVREAAIEAGL